MPAGAGGATGTLGGAAVSAAVGCTAAVSDGVTGSATRDRAARVGGVVVDAEDSWACAVVPSVNAPGEDSAVGAVGPAEELSGPPPLAGVKFPLPLLEWVRVVGVSGLLVPVAEVPVPLEEPP
jgi:hypothetical protein